MKKSLKDQTTTAFQVGGYVAPTVPTNPYSQPSQVNPQTGTYTLPGTGIAGYQIPSGGPTGYTPYGGAAPYFQPVQFTGPQFQTSLQTTNLPTFAETVGSKPGQYDELRTYVNDAGQILQIPFKDGQPIYPIPEGYRPQVDQPAAEEPTTVAPTLGQTQVTNDGGGEGGGDLGSGNIGYQGLSATTGSGGLTEASAKAKSDLGITGFSGHSVGSMMAFAGFALGIPGSMGLAGKQGLGFMGVEAPTPGMTGTLTGVELSNISNMNPTEAKNLGYAMTPEMARSVLDAQANYGVSLSGNIGYQTGDISPTYGTAVKNGMTTNSGYGGNHAEYSSIADMMNTIEKGNNAGWRGGYVDKDTYDSLSKNAKENYDNFDNTHKGYDIISKDPKALEAYEKGNMPQDNQVTGTPTSQDVQDAFDMADAAYGNEPATGYDDVGFDSSGNDNPGGGTAGSDSGSAQGGGYGGGTDCLTEDMKVKLNGVIDFVTNIKVGDMIDNYRVKEVLHKHMRSGYYTINNELRISNDHPVLANGTWTRPEDLVVGDSINGIPVASLEYIERMTPTVSIVIDGESFDVHTENNIYTVHGRYREVRQEAA